MYFDVGVKKSWGNLGKELKKQYFTRYEEFRPLKRVKLTAESAKVGAGRSISFPISSAFDAEVEEILAKQEIFQTKILPVESAEYK